MGYMVSFSLGHFTPVEIFSGVYWAEGWVSPRTGVDTLMKRKISCPARDWTSIHRPYNPYSSRNTDYIIPANELIAHIYKFFI
jgi:hypothetical protein